jgi:endonuclease/exonuclease/phosphatase family metal-dependent hydrolase
VLSLVLAAVSLVGFTGSDVERSGQLRVLQMNLCNSGKASCYTGRALTQAAAVIRAERPDVVTLNEVCHSDIANLGQAMAQAHRGGTVMTEFQHAFNDLTGRPVECRDGQQFGNGLLVHVPRPDGTYLRYGGIYPMQHHRDELRAWLCLKVMDDFYACVTHLSQGSADTARAQCEYLVGTAIPGVRPSADSQPTVIGADLNLSIADAASCGRPAYAHVVDGNVQHILASADLRIHSTREIDMHGATDHPGLLAVFGLDHTPTTASRSTS